MFVLNFIICSFKLFVLSRSWSEAESDQDESHNTETWAWSQYKRAWSLLRNCWNLETSLEMFIYMSILRMNSLSLSFRQKGNSTDAGQTVIKLRLLDRFTGSGCQLPSGWKSSDTALIVINERTNLVDRSSADRHITEGLLGCHPLHLISSRLRAKREKSSRYWLNSFWARP